ncbi:MAG: hypothetical protein IT356_10355 [Gemmatimonadaceae bacterium]|nr:hypothetical protein [Gemmatimonadaceae bacterium]
MSMSHLPPERLAALADDTPTPIEAAHITTCLECTADLAAHRRLQRAAAEASATAVAPSYGFDALLPRLRGQGITQAPSRRAAVRRWTVRVAAALGFLFVGGVAGRMSAGAPFAWRGAAEPIPAALAKPVAFASQDDAMKTLVASQELYQNAAAYLAAQDTTQHFIGLNSDSYRTRLAALDNMAAASRTALYRSPQDPLLNQYYLAFQTAREQTLRALAVSMPATQVLEKY